MAAQKSSGAGSSLRTFYIVLAVVAVGGLAALGYAVLGGGGEAATEPVELEGVASARQLYERAKPEVLGDPSTPVKIVEFGDFQCPGCRSFAMQIKPVLKERFVDTGKAHFVYYDFPLMEIHPHAFLAARAARCAADQGGTGTTTTWCSPGSRCGRTRGRRRSGRSRSMRRSWVWTAAPSNRV